MPKRSQEIKFAQDTQEGDRRVWAVQGFDGGLVTSYPAHSLGGDQSPDAENFDPSVKYMLKKRAGTSNFSGDKGSPTGTIIRGLYAGAYQDGTVRMIAKEGTAIHDVVAGDWSTTITGLTVDDSEELYMNMFNNNIIVTTSDRVAPVKLGSTGNFSALGGSPPSGKYNIGHRNRFWIANTSADPSRLYFSALNNAEDWSTVGDAGDLYIMPGDGMNINGLATDGDVLYISKQAQGGEEGAIYAIFGQSPTEYTIRRVAWFGALNQQSFKLTQKNVCAVTTRGIYLLSGLQLLHISDVIDQTISDLSSTARAAMCVGYYLNQIWVGYPASGSVNTKFFVYDVLEKRWGRHAFGASNIAARLMTVHPDGTLYGAATGTTIRVIKYNTGTSDIGSTAINLYWWTPDLDFGQWFADKQVTEVALHTKTSQTGLTWAVTYYIDGVDASDSGISITPASGVPVKKYEGKRSVKYGKFWQFKINESSTSAAEVYGLQVAAQMYPRTRRP